MTSNAPLLTIGLPVYNGGTTLRAALTALTTQTRGDFRLVIGDNASTDDTPLIAREFADRDPRITIVRRPALVSAIDNFRLLIETADTPFFMFAPADDWWAPRFVETVLAALIAAPSASLACSRIAMIAADGTQTVSNGTNTLDGDAETRLRQYLRRPGDGSRFYGIHRTALFQQGFAALTPMPAFDWLTLIPGLMAGTHIEVPEVLMHRDATPIERYRDWVLRLEPNPIGRVLPNLRLARAMMKMLPPPLRRRLFRDIMLMCAASMPNSPYPAARSAYANLLNARRLLSRRA
ncbi:glycosyltransferase family 2 protein [Glacieibacterium frigidum]|nr:glycosyltransferase family A protein [Glacieibacterium frigidum]